MDAAARHRSERLRGYAAGALAVSALAVMFVGGDGGQWEWPPSPTQGVTSEHLHNVRGPGWAPLSLVVAADTPWPTVHLPAVPGRMEGHDVEALSHLDARDHPGTTEAIVTAAATGRVRAFGGSLSEAEMDALLEVTGWPVEWRVEAKAIAWCESKWSPGAVGDGGNSLGLFQMWTGWFRDGEDPFGPATNARVALRVREIRGRWGGGGGWSCAGLNGIG